MLLAKPDSVTGIDVMKIGQGVGGEHLKVDAGSVHIGQPDLGFHKRATLVANAVKTIISHPKPGRSRFGVADFWPVLSRRTHRCREHRMGVYVD